jgi:CO/xanthine dehydrogenase Mo-binding subunit
MERAFALTDYQAKRERFSAENPQRTVKKGIGFATFMHGAGFTGSGEDYLKSVVGLEATAEGRFRILVASTEIGQGTNTILCQIAANALGVDYSSVEIAQPDTAAVPNSGPTVASRTCMIVGKLVESAALKLKQMMAESPEARPLRASANMCATRASAGTTKSIRATPMALSPGPSTWPRCRWTCGRGRRVWTISSPCRKWAK